MPALVSAALNPRVGPHLNAPACDWIRWKEHAKIDSHMSLCLDEACPRRRSSIDDHRC